MLPGIFNAMEADFNKGINDMESSFSGGLNDLETSHGLSLNSMDSAFTSNMNSIQSSLAGKLNELESSASEISMMKTELSQLFESLETTLAAHLAARLGERADVIGSETNALDWVIRLRLMDIGKMSANGFVDDGAGCSGSASRDSTKEVSPSRLDARGRGRGASKSPSAATKSLLASGTGMAFWYLAALRESGNVNDSTISALMYSSLRS